MKKITLLIVLLAGLLTSCISTPVMGVEVLPVENEGITITPQGIVTGTPVPTETLLPIPTEQTIFPTQDTPELITGNVYKYVPGSNVSREDSEGVFTEEGFDFLLASYEIVAGFWGENSKLKLNPEACDLRLYKELKDGSVYKYCPFFNTDQKAPAKEYLVVLITENKERIVLGVTNQNFSIEAQEEINKINSQVLGEKLSPRYARQELGISPEYILLQVVPIYDWEEE